MKRWGFSGGSASHGNSLAHRTPGSTGQRQVNQAMSSHLHIVESQSCISRQKDAW
jgi:ribosomal protein L3